MDERRVFWSQVFVEFIRKNGTSGDVAKAIDEANKALEAFDKIAAK